MNKDPTFASNFKMVYTIDSIVKFYFAGGASGSIPNGCVAGLRQKMYLYEGF